MKPSLIRKGIAMVSVVFGLWWIWVTLSPAISGDQKVGASVLSLVMGTLMAIPGVIATIFGYQFFRRINLRSLKWIVGVFAAFCAFWISARLELVFPALLPEGVQWIAFLLVGTAFALPAYIFTLLFLLPHLGIDRPPVSILLGRGVLILLAWQLWLLLSSLFEEYSPIKEGYTHIHREPWGTLGFVVPIIVAYGVFRLAVGLLNPSKAEAQDAGDDVR